MIRSWVLVAVLMAAPSSGLADDNWLSKWNYGLAPNGQIFVAYRFCKNDFCVGIQSQNLYGQTPIPMSDAGKHPLLGAGGSIENAVGASILEALIPGASGDFLVNDEIRAVSRTDLH